MLTHEQINFKISLSFKTISLKNKSWKCFPHVRHVFNKLSKKTLLHKVLHHKLPRMTLILINQLSSVFQQVLLQRSLQVVIFEFHFHPSNQQQSFRSFFDFCVGTVHLCSRKGNSLLPRFSKRSSKTQNAVARRYFAFLSVAPSSFKVILVQ